LEPFFLGRLGTSAAPAAHPADVAPAAVRSEAAVGAREDLPNRSGRTGRPPADGHAAPAPPPIGLPPLRAPSNVTPEIELNSVGKTMVESASAPAAFGDYG